MNANSDIDDDFTERNLLVHISVRSSNVIWIDENDISALGYYIVDIYDFKQKKIGTSTVYSIKVHNGCYDIYI